MTLLFQNARNPAEANKIKNEGIELGIVISSLKE